MSYDFKVGKQRVLNILNNQLKIEGHNQSGIPSDRNFTYDNAYYGWVTAIFVDIRDSTTLFSQQDKEKVSKIVRSFTSEIIEILDDKDGKRRSIGIRGDCVFAIYSTPDKNDIQNCFNKSCEINTYIKMLNKLLSDKGYSPIKIGIGLATSQELVVKAGKKGSGISDSVWIGEAVSGAANLSSLGNKNNIKSIVINNTAYSNLHEQSLHLLERNFNNNCYHGDIINTVFNKWIDDGMHY